MNKKNIMIFYKRNTIQIIALVSLAMLLLISCSSTTTTEPLPTLMPTAAVSAIQPTIISTSIASQTNRAIAPSLQEFKDYYQMNHNLQWFQRPSYSGVTPWAGIRDSSTVERKLMLWVPIGKSEVKEMFYSYYLPTTTQLNTQQKKELYNEMVEVASLSFPDWTGGEEWITSSLNDYFSNGQEEFRTYETQVNGRAVLLELSTSHEYNDFGAMFSYGY